MYPPEMLISSHLTMTTFWPLRMSLATMEARRPIMWPLPSITTALGVKPGILLKDSKMIMTCF